MARDQTRMLLFVYGTLMREEPGHHHLGGARFVGEWVTPARFRMVVVDWYPAICAGEERVEGEVFEVSPAQMVTIDAYEGDEYVRETLQTKWGPAAVYVAPSLAEGLEVVPDGRWRSVAERFRRGGLV